MKLRLLLSCLLGFFIGAANADLRNDDPTTLVEDVTGRIFAEVADNLEAYQNDEELLKDFVRKDLLPLLDVDYCARLILGRAGRGIDENKINEFANVMSNLLVDRYSHGLLKFASRVELQVLPQRGELNPRMTRVRTRVTLPEGRTAPVDYAFRQTPDGWKAFDVIIEGISYITTYRNQIMPEVQANGIESVIERLNRGELDLPDKPDSLE